MTDGLMTIVRCVGLLLVMSAVSIPFSATARGACGEPEAGSCSTVNATPYCQDESCCEAVCAVDPYCCETRWDGICVALTDDFPDACGQVGCGSPDAGNCLVENDSPHCDNEACCQAVCAVDPYCCDTRWDDLCADQAASLFPEECGVTGGGCCLPDGTCQVLTPGACETFSGAYQGDQTSCTDVICPQPGACCRPDGSCAEGMMETACTASFGTFQGAGTGCGGVNCPESICNQPFADADGDGDVDMEDFAAFQRCLSDFLSDPYCICFDRAAPKGELGVADLEAFAHCFTGPTILHALNPNPNCGDD